MGGYEGPNFFPSLILHIAQFTGSAPSKLFACSATSSQKNSCAHKSLFSENNIVYNKYTFCIQFSHSCHFSLELIHCCYMNLTTAINPSALMKIFSFTVTTRIRNTNGRWIRATCVTWVD